MSVEGLESADKDLASHRFHHRLPHQPANGPAHVSAYFVRSNAAFGNALPSGIKPGALELVPARPEARTRFVDWLPINFYKGVEIHARG